MKIKRNDLVRVIAGKDRGKEGKVIEAYPAKDRVLVEGVNMVKRHVKPSQRAQKGGIIEKEASLHVSNVTKISAAE
jgi:large subunit ribosomal protein L24